MARITPMKAIRLKCLDCCCDGMLEIRACSVTECPLWRFRLGLHPLTIKNSKNPFLQAKNFSELENKMASEVVDIVSELKEK
jgi:hypothetical protein